VRERARKSCAQPSVAHSHDDNNNLTPPNRGKSTLRVFWIVDNGSDHRGKASIKRLQGRWRTLILVHLPVHASWLNQSEIYHSIIQRKLLTPNNFDSTAQLARALNDFEHHYNQIAKPFDWTFTRDDLADLLTRLDEHDGDPPLALAA
jgi:hypothetical protein